MAASSSKRSDSDEIYDKLMLYNEDDIPIIVLKEKKNSVEGSKNLIRKADSDIQSSVPVNDTSVDVPDSCSVTVVNPVSVAVPALFRDIKDWGKLLKDLPRFTIREIELHRLKCGKTPESAIIKTLDRGRKFKEERYISADSIFTYTDKDHFYVKCKCKASMKKDIRTVYIQLNRLTAVVKRGNCSCPAGLSGYCNHVMALLLELADYSLSELKYVPEEIACTSRLRQWGIPGVISIPKAPVMETTVQKSISNKGISSTLYDPRNAIESDLVVLERLVEMQEELKKENKNIGFACCIPPIDADNVKLINTIHGEFLAESPLSYHLNPIGYDFEIKTNIPKLNQAPPHTQHLPVQLPFSFFQVDCEVIPHWELSDESKNYIESISVTNEESILLESETVEQASSELWINVRKNKITSSNAFKVLIRKRNFETLIDTFLKPKPTHELPPSVRDNMSHGKAYEPIAREKYRNALYFYLNRDCAVRETGCVIQPHLPWLLASPDGLVFDAVLKEAGLIEIKCPKTKRFYCAKDLLEDDSFYIGKYENGHMYLKKDHRLGYYTQVQMALGLSGLNYSDFVVYTHRCMLIVRFRRNILVSAPSVIFFVAKIFLQRTFGVP